ncbi:MAG: thermonuclease family protein [bacterium]
MRIKYEKYIAFVVLLIGAIGYCFLYYLPNRELIEEYAIVSRVIDGDTIILADGGTVRYIGINAPESVHPDLPVQCFGKQASDENKKLVQGKKVRLLKDISDKDKYGRLLRYVFVDDIHINEYLVKNGYARANTYLPDVKYQNQLKQAQAQAKKDKLGLWADEACK